MPTVIDSFYLLTLGCYRFFYIPNWILIHSEGGKVPTVSLIFGIIQTAFYLDFAWVYYTRQRVKLRNGALVDSEDFTKGWLVNRILSRAGFKGNDYDGPVDGRAGRTDPEFGLGDDEDDEGAPASRPRRVGSQGGWGKRGISVSADDDEQAGSLSSNSRDFSGDTLRSDDRRGMLGGLDEENTQEHTGGRSEWK